MIKVKKLISILQIFFLVLSSIAIAESSESISSGSSGYANEAIVKQKVVGGGSMIGLYMKGEVSEDDLRKMAKDKMGDKFDEMQFQKDLMESKQRMERKDVFSYEHEGYGQGYDSGPSYDGYSKEQIIFGMVFGLIGDDIDPRDIKQYCAEPDKIADIVISKLEEKVGDIQKICSRFEEEDSKCGEYAKKGCLQMGTARSEEHTSELQSQR